jgi:hypothetical protein
LTLAGGKYLPHDHLANAAALDTRAFQRSLNRGLAKFMSRQVSECPVESADWRAGSAHNDDIVFHQKLLLRS